MNDDDVALFKRAEMLSYSGQALMAYQLFRDLRDRGNTEIEILFWIVETTPNAVEARQVLDDIHRIHPGPPLIPRMEALHNRKLQTTYTPPTPVLLCQYCGARAPVVVKRNLTIGSWAWFAVWFLFFLGAGFDKVPEYQVSGMGWLAFIALTIGIAGLFFIRKRTYVCGSCGANITDAG